MCALRCAATSNDWSINERARQLAGSLAIYDFCGCSYAFCGEDFIVYDSFDDATIGFIEDSRLICVAFKVDSQSDEFCFFTC